MVKSSAPPLADAGVFVLDFVDVVKSLDVVKCFSYARSSNGGSAVSFFCSFFYF